MAWVSGVVNVLPSSGKAVPVLNPVPHRKYATIVHRGSAVVYLGYFPGIIPNGPGTFPFYVTDTLKLRNFPDGVWAVTSNAAAQPINFIADVN